MTGGGLLGLGVSHKTAPVALRERLALPEGRATRVLADLVAHDEIHEAVAISTCNRTELYLVAGDRVVAETEALGVLARQADIPPTELLGRLYSVGGMEAVRHLFNVTAGLDSMIVGEAEVQGQVKRAYELALVEGVTGPLTNRLFRDALGAGKRVRTETGVGRAHVSIASVAVELAEHTLGDLQRRRVLVVGAGGNGELTAQALREAGVETVWVANRRHDRAIGLAQRFGGVAVRFENLPAELVQTDIVVSSTGSPHQIIDRDELEWVMEERAGRRLLLIDIAVPRDIAPGVRDLSGVTLYDMDDLQREVARNRSGREAEAGRAATIVDEQVEEFARYVASLDVVPTIAALRERGDAIVDQALLDNERRWESLSAADRRRVEALTRSIVGRLLHEPTLRLRRSVGHDDSYVYVQAMRELFALEPEAAGVDEDDRVEPAAVASLDERRARSR